MTHSKVTHGSSPLGTSTSNATNVKDKPIDMHHRKISLLDDWAIAENTYRKKSIQVKTKLEEAVKKLEKSRKENKELMKHQEIIEREMMAVKKRAGELQAQHYDRSKNIKVTDDDFSTIIAKLGKFSGKLSNFPPNSKSCFKKDLSREELIEFFIKHNFENKAQIEFLFDQDKDRIDYALVSVLVEKLITTEIVKHIYRAAIHLDSKVNEAFEEIQKLFVSTNHEGWMNDFRLKISKATHDLIHRYKDEKAKDINNAKRKLVIDSIVQKLSVIYDKEEDIRSRIEKLVDMAIELSLPIRGQEDLVEIIDLKVDDPVYKNQVKPMYRQFDSTKIILGVSPVFLAKSTIDDENQSGNEEEEGDITRTYLRDHTLVYPGKAIY
ncbi:hypothetical protein INT48_009797 [Thamnidium elegans]|uniref:Uncharacterized protein n=1 Tax=Thamnidium elegans TaxID=101142 RepID=A0A8H7SR07_9FUNG|nr:hypothetical protein INT48_009797 [Thamnidium elegans]